MAQVTGVITAEGTVAVMVGNEVLKCLLPGDEGSLKDIVQQVDFRADASCLRVGQVGIDVHQDFAGLVQILNHFIQIIGQGGKAAHDDKAGHRHAHGGEGHKAMEENTPEALFQQISKIIQLH